MDVNKDLPWYKTVGIWTVGLLLWAVVAITFIGILFGQGTGPGDTGHW